MGREFHEHSDDVEFEGDHPRCTGRIFNVLDHHHWYNVKRMFPYRKDSRGKHAICCANPQTISMEREPGKTPELLDGEEGQIQVQQQTRKTGSTNKSSCKASTKGLTGKEKQKEQNHKHRILGFSAKPQSPTACLPAEHNKIEILLRKLTSSNPEDQRMAAGEIRLLAKQNADNRVPIAEAGAIPLLVNLLSTPDSRTQEHAVTALLNLSICEDNKGSIISSGAVPGIVQVLKKGSMETRENAAATLFSLSVVDENKVTIGASGAVSPLVTLLSEGTQRGKKDAATALFNLCIYQGNKGKAVRAGVVPTLMRLLTEPGGGMLDEALAILAILSSHPEGKSAIGAAGAVPVLVDVIGNGSPRNRENAAAVLVHLCAGDQQHLAEAQERGVMGPLVDLAQNGTDRGKRKAAQLIERMSRFDEQQKLAQAQSQAEAQAQLSQSQTQLPQPHSVANPVDS